MHFLGKRKPRYVLCNTPELTRARSRCDRGVTLVFCIKFAESVRRRRRYRYRYRRRRRRRYRRLRLRSQLLGKIE